MSINPMKEIRTEKRMSIKDLSKETGLTERYLYFIECGKRNPSMKSAKKISIALGKSMEEIFFAPDQN